MNWEFGPVYTLMYDGTWVDESKLYIYPQPAPTLMITHVDYETKTITVEAIK